MPAQTSFNSVTFGTYPVSSSSLGTTYGTIFFAVNGSSSSNTGFYSTDGITWTGVSMLGANTTSAAVTFNGKRFIAVSGLSNITLTYSYNPTLLANWYTSGITPTASQLFSSTINGLATSAWPTVGSAYIDQALTLSSSTGLNTNNQLDIYSDTYFNNGYNNFSTTIKATQIP